MIISTLRGLATLEMELELPVETVLILQEVIVKLEQMGILLPEIVRQEIMHLEDAILVINHNKNISIFLFNFLLNFI